MRSHVWVCVLICYHSDRGETYFFVYPKSDLIEPPRHLGRHCSWAEDSQSYSLPGTVLWKKVYSGIWGRRHLRKPSGNTQWHGGNHFGPALRPRVSQLNLVPLSRKWPLCNPRSSRCICAPHAPNPIVTGVLWTQFGKHHSENLIYYFCLASLNISWMFYKCTVAFG